MLLAVGLPAEAAEADAEGMEHHASHATLKAFARFVASQTATTAVGISNDRFTSTAAVGFALNSSHPGSGYRDLNALEPK